LQVPLRERLGAFNAEYYQKLPAKAPDEEDTVVASFIGPAEHMFKTDDDSMRDMFSCNTIIGTDRLSTFLRKFFGRWMVVSS
jgi:hypothetical protein